MSNKVAKTSNNPIVIKAPEREMTIMDYMPIIYMLGTPIVLAGVYFVVVNPILKRLGIKDSAEDKAYEKINEDVSAGAFWSPTYYKQNGGATISSSYADVYAQRLYCSMFSGYWSGCGTQGFLGIGGGWGTDESAIAGVFEALGSKGNISLVAERYNEVYDSNLQADLESELDEQEFGRYVSNKISKYPS
jgi:hypothetical protein